MASRVDAVVVGAGPNGLAAAITIAERGFSVRIVESAAEPGGACRSAALTLPGFHHDVGAAVLPFAVASPFFRAFDVARNGAELVHSPAPLAHPLDGAEAVVLDRDIAETATQLGPDGGAYRRLLTPLARHAPELLAQFLGPLRLPRHPILVGAFGVPALLPAAVLGRGAFRGRRARALFAGLGAHSTAPLTQPATASAALVMAMTAHAAGWPIMQGGTDQLIGAMVRRFEQLGGTIDLGRRARSLADLPQARVQLLDLSARDVASVCGDALPTGFRRRLAAHPNGPGVFKLDWALNAPIPWSDPGCARAATVHLAGDAEAVVSSEAAVAAGGHPDRPFVILVQPSLFDASRAPAGRHTAWAYCHVPNGSRQDMTTAIEAQVERFAPGFSRVVAARHAMDTAALESHDANLVGGDINGGRFALTQLFLRPAGRLSPYTTPNPAILVCSAATPPGGGVHGMCGWWAAQAAIRRLRRRDG